MPSEAIKISIALSVLAILAVLPSLADIITSLLGCLVRWKESVNLESSTTLKRARNNVALGMMPLFILLCSEYGLCRPLVFGDEGILPLLSSVTVFAAYMLVRLLCRVIFRSNGTRRQCYDIAVASVRNFFIIVTLLMSVTALVCAGTGTDTGVVSDILSWEVIAVYGLFLFRKTQIFAHYSGFFSGILYLCTLEILPTGLLVASMLLL